MKSTEFDRFAEIRRIQQKEYKRVVEVIALEKSRDSARSYPIFTDRSTMERKETTNQVAGKTFVKKR